MPLDFGAIRAAPQQESVAGPYAAQTAAQRDASQAAAGPYQALAAFVGDQLNQQRITQKEARDLANQHELLTREYQLRGGLAHQAAQDNAASDLLVLRAKQEEKAQEEQRHMAMFNHAVTDRADIVETQQRSLLEATPMFGMPYAEALRYIKKTVRGADDEAAAELYKGLSKKVPVVRIKDGMHSAYSMKYHELASMSSEGEAKAVMEQLYGHPAANTAEELGQLYEAGGHESPFFPRTSIQTSELGPTGAAAANLGNAQPYKVTPDNAGDVLKDWAQIPQGLIDSHYGADTQEGKRIADVLNHPDMRDSELDDQGVQVEPVADQSGNLSSFTVTAKDPRFALLIEDYAHTNPAFALRLFGAMQAGGADITNSNKDKLGIASQPNGRPAPAPAPTPAEPPADASAPQMSVIESTIGDYLNRAKKPGGK